MTTVNKAAKTKTVSATATELKAARALVKTLTEKNKAEIAAAKVAKSEARTKRIAERKAKLEAALKKLETVGKGAAKAKAATRKPGPVQIIKPAE